MVLTDRVEVREHTTYDFASKGIFAKEAIREGDVLWECATPLEQSMICTREEIINADKLSIIDLLGVRGRQIATEKLTDCRKAVHNPKEVKGETRGGCYAGQLRDSATTIEELSQLSAVALKDRLVKFSYMVDDDQYETTLLPDEDPGFFFNHSCDPNCWFSGDNCIVALKDIPKGAHICYDYGMTETEASLHEGMHCCCGAACCRKILRFSNYRSNAWMKKFGQGCTEFIKNKASEHGWYHASLRLRFLSPGTEHILEKLSNRLRKELKNGNSLPIAKCEVDHSPEEPHSGYVLEIDDDKPRGLFAGHDIKKGTVLIVFAGKIVDRQALEQVSERELQLSLQISEDLWQIPVSRPITRNGIEKLVVHKETGDFINHSCDANCGMRDSVTAVAMRNIAKDEQITIDYALVNNGANARSSDNFVCQCGATTCRKFVTTNDFKLPSVQQRYRGFFPPFVQSLIDQEEEGCTAQTIPVKRRQLKDIVQHKQLRMENSVVDSSLKRDLRKRPIPVAQHS